MCGIVGYIAHEQVSLSQLKQALIQSTNHIAHRGPDDTGHYCFRHFGLGFRRLAIQDLSPMGHQPMMSQTERFAIVFNGEIYNFKEIRQDLENQGHCFISQSDTEVILKCYELMGRACLSLFNGMFALAILDKKTRMLFLARDRFGVKPLYVAKSPLGFLFASEYKAFLPFISLLNLDWRVRTDLVPELMLFRSVLAPNTMIECVQSVSPGICVEVDELLCDKKIKYYDLYERLKNTQDNMRNSTPCLEQTIELLDAHLLRSTRLRMISDAPIGVALSGGLDSSLITAMMRTHTSQPIDSFSVVFDAQDKNNGLHQNIDESFYSDWVSKTYHTRHHRILFSFNDFVSLYPQALWLCDDPLHYPNSIGILQLSLFARQHGVKVLLGGEGADEVCAGYPFFTQGRVLHPLKNQTTRIRDVRRLIRFKQLNLLDRKSFILKNPFVSRVNRTSFYAMHTYLPSIENRLDKMSMGGSIEFRTPFLDYQLVEFVMALPDVFKITHGITKFAVKKMAEKYFPKEHIYRPKIGFSTPLNQWMRHPLFKRYIDVLKEERTLCRPFYHRAGILSLLQRFEQQADTPLYSYAGQIWNLLNFELWQRMMIEDRQPL